MFPTSALFSPDGSKLYVNDNDNGTSGLLGIFDTSTWAWSSVPVDAGNGRVIELFEDASGLLWIGGNWTDQHGFDTWDGSKVTTVAGSLSAPGYRGFCTSRDGAVVYAVPSGNSPRSIEAFDPHTMTSLWVSDNLPEDIYTHRPLVTP